MTKIAYNADFGGFSLSLAAIERGREISGDPKWGGTIAGEYYEDGSGPASSSSNFNSWGSDIPRTDPTLIAVIEELGKAANGRFARLKIHELPSGTKYRIDEYDGNERVMTPDDYDWETA
jgi:hypothetical protein